MFLLTISQYFLTTSQCLIVIVINITCSKKQKHNAHNYGQWTWCGERSFGHCHIYYEILVRKVWVSRQYVTS